MALPPDSTRSRVLVVVTFTALVTLSCVVVALVALSFTQRETTTLGRLLPLQVTIESFDAVTDDVQSAAVRSRTDRDAVSEDVIETAAQAAQELLDVGDTLTLADDDLRAMLSDLDVALDGYVAALRAERDAHDSTGARDPGSVQNSTAAFDLLDAREDDVGAAVAAAIRDANLDAEAGRQVVRYSLIVTTIFVIVAAIVSYLVLRGSLVLALDRLLRSITAAEIDLATPIDSDGPTELRQIAAHVDEMRRRLADESSRKIEAALISGHHAERARLAGEIHDDPVQALTLVSIRLQQLAHQTRDDPEFALVVAQAIDATSRATDRMRRMVFELHSPVLESDGLAAAIECYIEETFDPPVEHVVNSRVEGLPRDVERLAYELARESLFNAFKHADAKQISVDLEMADDDLVMTIRDDGRGFDSSGPTVARPGHLGVTHSAQQAAAIGGSWQVDSAPGRGTVVRIRLPRQLG